MTELTLESDSPEATQRLGRLVGEALSAGARVALIGPLGAGKTCFIQGLAAGLGCREPVRSPSYTLVQEYEGRHPFYHCDWYRLETEADVESTGFEDLLRPDSVVAVEWADKGLEWLPAPKLEIEIEWLGESRRRIRLRDAGNGAFGETLDRIAAML